ncbi:gliding motility-associated C-terminal domain-containing protein [Adhaeribacter terreus]|uniref:Gliding motility-associated C-terminal domain-containing protein n=1 Tax=Adhaeribacter terreus TaxID=529703 RepID=A0ABW0EE35_9BACT
MKTSAFPKLLFLLLTGILLHLNAKAQKEANVWYFGNNFSSPANSNANVCPGLSFNSNPPLVLHNGQARGQFGFASMCDAAGNLLFYAGGSTNGSGYRLFDRRHQAMPNSIAATAGAWTTSPIVPWPGQPQKYFYFGETGGSFRHKACLVVDMTLNGGFGDVSSSSTSLPYGTNYSDPFAVQHRNNRDFWIIFYNSINFNFNAHLISPTGLNQTPVISSPVFPPGVLRPYGLIKISPDGKTIALVLNNSPLVLPHIYQIRLFNFDAVTGNITYKGALPDSLAKSVEFSPDGSKLYSVRVKSGLPTAPYPTLVQYDLDAGSPAAIYNSAVNLYQSNLTALYNLQVGPDGKIYITSGNPLTPTSRVGRYMSVFNRPNLKGIACRFIPNMLDLDPNNTGNYDGGIDPPTFVQSYFYRPKITMQQTCFGDTAFFALGNPAYVDSVEWNFGDPASGVQNTSTLFNPKHFYATPGPKQVQAIVHFNFYSDTLSQTIYIPATIVKPNLGNDTTLCMGDTLRLNAYQPGASYEWQDSINTDSVYVVTKPGTYWVSISNGCGTLGDSIVVNFNSPLSLSLPADTTLCPGEILTLQVNATGGNLLWSDSTSAATFTVSKPGTYWAELSNACGSWRDSITVNYIPVVKNNWLPKDTILCSTGPFEIKGSNPAALSYRWQDGTTAPTFTAQTSGTYWLEITTTCTTVRDSILVTINKLPTSSFSDTTICNGDSFRLTAPKALSYRWSTGDIAQSISISKAGIYKVELETVPNCFFSDSLEVKTERCFKTAFIPNIVTPNNDKLNDKFEPKGLEAGEYELSIYHRWGTLIYQQQNYTNQWPDKKLSDGTYYYLLRNKLTGKTYKGWVEVAQ